MATASAADPRPKTVALGRKAGWSAGRRGGRGWGGWGWVGVERGAAVGGDGRGLVLGSWGRKAGVDWGA